VFYLKFPGFLPLHKPFPGEEHPPAKGTGWNSVLIEIQECFTFDFNPAKILLVALPARSHKLCIEKSPFTGLAASEAHGTVSVEKNKKAN